MSRNDINAAILMDRQGREVALTGVRARAKLHDLMAEVEVEQSYENPTSTNIEAVYTFPLPLDAVLLGFEVEIAGEKLSGTVVEKLRAERDYEEAIIAGNSAIILEESGPGLYTVSLGNLMAGEKAVIRYRYGFLLSWQGERMHFMMPTTIAPRYGSSQKSGLQPHQEPEASLEVEYPLELEVAVQGTLSQAEITSPSHAVSFGKTEVGIVIRIAGLAVLDRDFVLTFRGSSIQSAGFIATDHEGYAALASFRIPQDQACDAAPLNLKVVIDCSGSMAGTSIAQARKASQKILTLLRPTDQFNITLFGNTHRNLFVSMVPVELQHLKMASICLEELDASMGGTEMGAALDAAFKIVSHEGEQSLLLITDGEIWQYDSVINDAISSGHRIFTVGVGVSVAEGFVKNIARKTGGAFELVAPQEGMAERVLAQFHRLRQPRLSEIKINWPAKQLWSTPLPEIVFAGDTVHIFAGFTEQVHGSVSLLVRDSAGKETEICAVLKAIEDVTLPRVAAARRMSPDNKVESLHLALKYQLLSPLTNYLVIAERSDKAKDLPEIHKVPQMLAAGWRGTGKVCDNTSPFMRRIGGGREIPTFSRRTEDAVIQDISKRAMLQDHRGISKPIIDTITDIHCPDCAGKLLVLGGCKRDLLACENFPNCEYVRNFQRNTWGNIQLVERETAKKLEVTCDKCGLPMVYRQRRLGLTLVCSGYPVCRNVKSQSTGVKCPKKGCDGGLVCNVSKVGKIFYHCNRYQRCVFAIWDKPVNQSCPTCGAAYLLEKKANLGTGLYCPNRKCEFWELPVFTGAKIENAPKSSE